MSTVGDDKTTVHPIAPEERRRKGARPVLEVVVGRLAGTTFELAQAQAVVGKGDAADIDLPDTGVSRNHAKVVVASDGGVNILDLASTNGTFVNEARVDLAALREGDRIRIGPEVVLRLGYLAPVVEDAPPQLSERQLEVARLVATGLTNAEIAERLGVKVRTVTSHLDHIYARLGIGSRAALTRFVLESGQD